MPVHKPHGARSRARPAATHSTATRQNAINEPVACAVHRPVHAPAQGGQREEEANHPQKKNREGGKAHPHTNRKLPEQAKRGAPSTPLGRTRQPGGAEEGRRDSRKTANPRNHSTKEGDPPARRDHGQHPRDPPLGQRETTMPSPTTGPSQRRRTTTATQRPTDQKKDHPGRADTDPRQGRGEPHTTQTRTQQGPPAGKQSKKKGGGGDQWDHCQNGRTTTPKNRKPHPQSPLPNPPATGDRSSPGRLESNTHKTRHKKKGRLGKQQPRRPPKQPPTTDGNDPRERQGC